ncbi:phosphatidylserine/phosphatidylglycerophosphate/cardiolipin synthase-like enzyme [Rhizobium sp. BK251]|nr:phosphatidylserine/phosphatidylglycerophosphate/cardiolipin synthase-like enzyme [Rhizobium sp. BK251]
MTPPRSGTTVTAFIDYVDYYKAIGETLARIAPNGVVVVAGWAIDLNTPIPSDGGMVGIGSLLARKGKEGCRVRVLLSGHINGPNTDAANWLNSQKGCAAIVDDRVLLAGCFHQKSVVAELSSGTVAFLGGMDFGAERLAAPDRAPWHDVQVKLEGPAAVDVFDTLADRWTTHQAANSFAHFALPRSNAKAVPSQRGCVAQVVKTYGNPRSNVPLTKLRPTIPSLTASPFLSFGSSPNPLAEFGFAPRGNSSIHDLLVRAIQSTEEYIYLEDQYFVASAEMARDRLLLRSLAKTISKPNFKHLIVLTCGVGTIQSELLQTNRRRRALWDVLGSVHPDKISVWCYKNGTDRCYWQHSKTWIFDDRFALVGSANFNRRGLSHDGELGVGFMDLSAGTGNSLPFPHDLRIRLWMKHLSTPRRPLLRDQLIDFSGARKFWTEAEGSFLARLDVVNGDPFQADRLLKVDPAPPSAGFWEKLFVGAGRKVQDLYKWSVNEQQNFANQWDYVLDPDGS